MCTIINQSPPLHQYDFNTMGSHPISHLPCKFSGSVPEPLIVRHLSTKINYFILLSRHPAILDTVDFVHADGRCMFRTCQAERERVVFQMVRYFDQLYRRFSILLLSVVWLCQVQGTADPERAVKTAKLV